MVKENVVSIILPIYNQEKYLDISIPAVMRQEYKNIEIILVNDGSTDSSKHIIEKYQKLDNRIVVINKPNGGLVDATVAGVKASHGEFICFLDPDDTIGEDFIANFINKIDDCDAIACGFYKNNSGKFNPVFLEGDSILEEDKLKKCRKELLITEKGYRNNHQVYIARWNKMYRTETVLKFIDVFSRCADVSLGEDSIFTFLLLTNCKKIRTTRAINSYYYNISNQSSMMKNGAIYSHYIKSNVAFEKLRELSSQYGDNDRQAYALFFYLIESLFQRLIDDIDQFGRLWNILKDDATYQKALEICHRINGWHSKFDFSLRTLGISPSIYLFLTRNFKRCRLIGKYLKWHIKGIPLLGKNIRDKGIIKAIYYERFRENRYNAFKDLKKYLPKLESRIAPMLTEFTGLKTDVTISPIENNVFVFWWDGFDKAPALVQQCFKSISEAYKGCRIIKISRENYSDYTDIHPAIVKGYLSGKISVQTFSDILRFNLLKNNGGVWIDATIYFEKPYNLLDGLKNKPIESVSFSTTADFLKYKNEVCSWSGYFFASRKNSVFVQAMDKIFRDYYLKYHTYSIYFFIDATLMICKINHIDNDALRYIQKSNYDMMLLAKLLNHTYDPAYRKHIAMIPQKLAWNYKDNGQKDNVYSVILNKHGDEI